MDNLYHEVFVMLLSKQNDLRQNESGFKTVTKGLIASPGNASKK